MRPESRPHHQALRVPLVMLAATVLLLTGCARNQKFPAQDIAKDCKTSLGGIIRGPADQKRIALAFTGHSYAEGGDTILNELARHRAHASFFITGLFLTNREFAPLVKQMDRAGHYIGPHSDAHLLYCEWDAARKTLVTHDQFAADLAANAAKLPKSSRRAPRFFLPPFEHYNPEIVAWSKEAGYTLINFTPGTRSNADYTGEADANFVSSQTIFDSILRREREDPSGLNGFILLLHVGSGPGRTDKFHQRFGELLDVLATKGYQFVRVDELLASPPNLK